ncbi:MAG: choice-of-anchor E domain-containing protein [Deltaproteobacteria bacterium]|nr:choice-of-anchor E domain-containing protein [Deltaproteobacteria bacterium]
MTLRRFSLAPMLFMTALAAADTVTYSATVPAQYTDFASVIQLLQFNPALGTLQQADLKISADLIANALIENRSAATATFSMTLTESASVVPPFGSFLTARANSIPTTPQTAAPFDGVPYTVDPNGADTVHWSINATGVTNTRTYTAPADLAVFTGLLNLNYTVLGDSSVSLSGTTANFVAQSSSQAGATVSITYTYVPEPASLALLFAGLAAMRRRS